MSFCGAYFCVRPAVGLVKRREAIQLLRIVSGTSRARPVYDKLSNSWLSIVTSLFKDTVDYERKRGIRYKMIAPTATGRGVACRTVRVLPS